MKRKNKNIIMITLLVILLGGIILTFYLGHANLKNVNLSDSNNIPRELPSDFKGEDFLNIDGNNGNSVDNEMPNRDMKGNRGPRRNNIGDNEDEMMTPPDLNNNECEEAQPFAEDNIDKMTPPKMENKKNNMLPMEQNVVDSKGSVNNTLYYILLGIESTLFVTILIYLILSKFNKKTIKETFDLMEDILIYILLVIILSGALIFGLINLMKVGL